jgi:uncharacterized membrane protein
MKKLLLLVLAILTLALSACSAADTDTYHAKVLSVRNEAYTEEGRSYSIQYLNLEFLNGPYKGMIYESEVFMDITSYASIALYRAGDTVEASVYLGEDGGSGHASVVTLVRAPYILILAGAFLLFIAVIGRFKGLKTILALIFTVGAVIFTLVPLISNGYDPILSAALVCIAVTLVTMFTIGGFNNKSLSAVLGTISGLICAAAFTLTFSSLMRVTGLVTSEVGLLMSSGTEVAFNYQGILTAGILIGCIGAVMDIGMSISSAMSEMFRINSAISRKKLFASGIAVGRDIIGTMANTLILAYAGGSLMLIVVWSVYGIPFTSMVNKPFIVLEIAKSLCGSIGMVLTIPLTAYIASYLVRLEKKHTAMHEGEEQGCLPDESSRG